MTFEFGTATRIVFGPGTFTQLPALAGSLGRRALVMLGGSDRGRDALAEGLAAAGVASQFASVGREPTTHLVDAATARGRTGGCDLVIAVGGGSVIDAGKAVAGMITNPGDVLDYLELVGGGSSLREPGVPFVAVPTTAGTGAEVTRNAVLDVPEQHVKVSLRSPHLMARVALVDPDLTLSVPPDVTAATGMDALTQLIEPFVSRAANPLTDALCRDGIARAARALPRVVQDGSDRQARSDMALAAMFSGIALANAKLGAVHGFAGVLGGITGHPHGALCARLLPFVMEANIRAIEQRGDRAMLARYDEVARLLTDDGAARSNDGVAWLFDLITKIGIPPLGTSGLTSADAKAAVPLAQRASSMQGNPLVLTDDELRGIIEAAL